MKMSPFWLKWMMRLYPPLLFNRIVLQRVSKDFKEIDVVIKRSFLNRNLQGTIFGGTIFSAADPFHSLMYWQIFAQQNIPCEAWLRAAEISYIKPGASNLHLAFRITDEDINDATQMLEKEGRVKKWHTVQMLNATNELCVEVKVLVYLRKKGESNKSVF